MGEQEELENKDLPEDLNPSPAHSLEPERKFPIKWILAGAISVLILVALSGAYLLGKNQTSKTPSPSPTKQSDETANWKTYENTKVGFSFRYPLQFERPLLPSGPGPAVFADGSEDSTDIIFGGNSGDYFSLWVFPFTGTLSTLNGPPSGSTFPPYDWTGKTTSITVEDITVDSVKAKLINAAYKSQSASDNAPFSGVFFISKGHGFIFHTSQNFNRETLNLILSTFKFTNSISAQTYLKIPELGVKIPLTDANKDAYYEIQPLNGEDIAELKVHSLDSEPYCNAGELSGIASLSKISKNDVGDGPIKFMIDAGNATLIGNYYYLIQGEQSVCSQKSSNMTIETNALKAFGSAAKNITVL